MLRHITARLQPETWRGIKERLSSNPGARVMANLGQSHVSFGGRPRDPEGYTTLRALDAMIEVFDGGYPGVLAVNLTIIFF